MSSERVGGRRCRVGSGPAAFGAQFALRHRMGCVVASQNHMSDRMPPSLYPAHTARVLLFFGSEDTVSDLASLTTGLDMAGLDRVADPTAVGAVIVNEECVDRGPIATSVRSINLSHSHSIVSAEFADRATRSTHVSLSSVRGSRRAHPPCRAIRWLPLHSIIVAE